MTKTQLTACGLRIMLLLFSVFALTQSSSTLAQTPSDENIFGVVEGFWLAEDVCELGAGWERIIFDWAQHQPSGPQDWNTLNVDERWLTAATECNREVIAIVKNTPAWATDGLAGPGLPRGLGLPIDDPNNLWANFMRRAAEYYQPHGVTRFIIWNEPDIEAGTYGYEFEGSVEDYALLLKVASLALREGNPNAKVHLAGTTFWHDFNEGRRLYLDRLLEVINDDPDAEANGYYFDAITLHIYFRVETVFTIVREMQNVLNQYGLEDKAIWIVETNASPNLDPLWLVERPQFQITLEQQANYLVQAAALSLAAGADAMGVYKFYDWSLPAGQESWGLVREDQTRRPAFDAWHMVIEQFNGVREAEFYQSRDVDAVRLVREDGQDVIVLWARTANTSTVELYPSQPSVQLLDVYGNMMEVTAVNNSLSLVLPPATCHEADGCPVGGFVSVLIYPHNDDFRIDNHTIEGVVQLERIEEMSESDAS